MKVAAFALIVLVLAGCATTARRRGDSALAIGDYGAAITEFRAALAENPDNLEALQGLGVAQYRAGAFAEAGATLEAALARSPQSAAALLYGALAAIQRSDDATAEDRLTRLRALETDPRFSAQVDRALEVLHAPPVGEKVRAFIAGSLEDAARAASEIRAARLDAYRAYWRDPFPYPIYCYPARRGGLICL